MNQLELIEKMSPIELFSNGNLDQILTKIGEEAKAFLIDISTPHGRKECASLAYKIARSKTFVDDLGKKLGEEAQAKLNAINSERKKSREYFDKLKDDIREPLTKWETAEKKRVEDHENELRKITEKVKLIETNYGLTNSAFVKEKITELQNTNREWQEFEARAKAEITTGINKLESIMNILIKQETEKAELEKFREFEALRIQKERDEKIAKEAAELAKNEAERIAKVEAERVAIAVEAERIRAAKEKADAEARSLAAERRAKEAAEAAEKEKIRAVEAERKRAEKAKQDEIHAAEKREANKKHATKINNEILSALLNVGATMEESLAKEIIKAIVNGKIPHTKISY